MANCDGVKTPVIL